MAGPLPGFNTIPASDLRRLRNLRVINDLADLPQAIDGVITLEDWVTYDIRVNVLDLNGARIQCAENNALIGGYAENTRIISTGLTDPLITGSTSMRLADIELSAAHVFDLRGDPSKSRRVLRFDNLNIVDSPNVGAFQDYQVITFDGCALRNVSNMSIESSISSFIFTNGLVVVQSDQLIQQRQSACSDRA